MMWKQIDRQRLPNGKSDENVLFVYHNGVPIYKKKLESWEHGYVFDLYGHPFHPAERDRTR